MARGPLLLGVVLVLAGCACREVQPPQLDVKAAARAALAEYDANKDGFLDANELRRCPGLRDCLPRWDQDKDGRLSEAEIEAGLEGHQKSGIGLTGVVCRVLLDERPLAGASVVLEPESFLGSGLKPARGTTDEAGRARPQAEGAKFPGCQLGVYRVRISKTEGGRDVVPGWYNREARFGIEVGPEMKSPYVFSLRTR
jgi:hypothetical protein